MTKLLTVYVSESEDPGLVFDWSKAIEQPWVTPELRLRVMKMLAGYKTVK